MIKRNFETNAISEVLATKSAQDIRALLARDGWVPITKLHGVEHWTRNGLHIALAWPGEYPDLVQAKCMTYARVIKYRNGRIKITHSSEISKKQVAKAVQGA